MDSINILLTGFKLLPIIQGIVCGGLFAAGLLLSWMLRSNLHGEMETEKEICQTAQNLLLPDRPGPQDFILLINKRENPAYLWGNILNISYNAAVASLFERYAFFLIRYICLIRSCFCANSLFELRHAPAFAGSMYLITEKSWISYQTRKPLRHCS